MFKSFQEFNKATAVLRNLAFMSNYVAKILKELIAFFGLSKEVKFVNSGVVVFDSSDLKEEAAQVRKNAVSNYIQQGTRTAEDVRVFCDLQRQIYLDACKKIDDQADLFRESEKPHEDDDPSFLQTTVIKSMQLWSKLLELPRKVYDKLTDTCAEAKVFLKDHKLLAILYLFCFFVTLGVLYYLWRNFEKVRKVFSWSDLETSVPPMAAEGIQKGRDSMDQDLPSDSDTESGDRAGSRHKVGRRKSRNAQANAERQLMIRDILAYEGKPILPSEIVQKAVVFAEKYKQEEVEVDWVEFMQVREKIFKDKLESQSGINFADPNSAKEHKTFLKRMTSFATTLALIYPATVIEALFSPTYDYNMKPEGLIMGNSKYIPYQLVGEGAVSRLPITDAKPVTKRKEGAKTPPTSVPNSVPSSGQSTPKPLVRTPGVKFTKEEWKAYRKQGKILKKQKKQLKKESSDPVHGQLTAAAKVLQKAQSSQDANRINDIKNAVGQEEKALQILSRSGKPLQSFRAEQKKGTMSPEDFAQFNREKQALREKFPSTYYEYHPDDVHPRDLKLKSQTEQATYRRHVHEAYRRMFIQLRESEVSAFPIHSKRFSGQKTAAPARSPPKNDHYRFAHKESPSYTLAPKPEGPYTIDLRPSTPVDPKVSYAKVVKQGFHDVRQSSAGVTPANSAPNSAPNSRPNSAPTSPRMKLESLLQIGTVRQCESASCSNTVQAPLTPGPVYCVHCHSLRAAHEEGRLKTINQNGVTIHIIDTPLAKEGLNTKNMPLFVDKIRSSIRPLFVRNSDLPILNGTKIGQHWITANHHDNEPLFFDRDCTQPLGKIVHSEQDLEFYVPRLSPTGAKSLGVGSLNVRAPHSLCGWMIVNNSLEFFTSPTPLNSAGYGSASSAPGVCGSPYIDLETGNAVAFHVLGGQGVTKGCTLSSQSIALLSGKTSASPKN
jgi:hypothetical protein